MEFISHLRQWNRKEPGEVIILEMVIVIQISFQESEQKNLFINVQRAQNSAFIKQEKM